MPRRVTLAIAAALTALSVSSAPAVATEAGGEGGGEQPATTQSPAGEGQLPPGEEPPVEEGEHAGEDGKAQLPLDLTDPQGILGLVFLLIAGGFTAAAGRNMIAQMRGERPTADGSWRPR